MDVIKKLGINIVLPPEIPQSSAMECANNCYERSFRHAVEKAISSFDESIEVVIPNIRIDLGIIEESEIPVQLERKLRDEIARFIRIDIGKMEGREIPVRLDHKHSDEIPRHITTWSTTGEETGAVDTSPHGEWTAQARAQDGIRSYMDGSALPDPRGTVGAANMETTHVNEVDRETVLPEDELTARSGDFAREDIARSLEDELFRAYLNYISEGHSDLEVLGRKYSLREIAAMIETVFVTPAPPGRKEHMSALLVRTLGKHFPLSYFRMEHTLPFPVFSRVILDSTEQSVLGFREVSQMVENMIKERAAYGSVSMALFAVSSFLVRQLAGRIGSQTERIGSQAGMSLPTGELESLTAFIQKLSRVASETVDSVLSAADLEALTESLPENASYGPLADTLPESPVFSDVLAGIRQIAAASLMKKELEKREEEHRLFTEDAGLVLLHPFFLPLFNRLGLLDEQDKFLSLDRQLRAVHLLKCLAEGFTKEQDDNDLFFCKLLCGLPYEFPIGDEFRIKEQEKQEINDLYRAILDYWNPFKSSSHESMRQAFIKRKGAVEKSEEGYVVRVAGSSIDILMDDLPWAISIFFLPWTSPFLVEWQKEQ